LEKRFYCISSKKFLRKFLKPKDAKEKERRFLLESALGKFFS